jgi:hypothetical protein
VRSKPTPSGLVLDLKLSPEASARLVSATADGVGRQLAVLINAQLVATAPIAAPLAPGTRRIAVALELPSPRAAEIAAAVTKKWPPQ